MLHTGCVRPSGIASIIVVLTSSHIQQQVAAKKPEVASPPTPEQSVPPAASAYGGALACRMCNCFFCFHSLPKHTREKRAAPCPVLTLSLLLLSAAGYKPALATNRHAKHLSPPKKMNMQVRRSTPRVSPQSIP